MNDKKYAIYSRKSKYTGKGESTTNQIELCLTTLKNKFPDIKKDEILIYEDEGFSGYSTNRPAFKKLLKDIENNKIKILLFYKLDRISRNVNDFARLMSLLEAHDVSFLSATENIETLTPSGKALTYMISVFAELERNTIAERIKDNMLELAKSGVWLGGNTPTGYSSVEEIKLINNKKKKTYCLKENEDIEKVELIFKNYLRLKSLTKLETFLLNKNILSINLKPYTRFSLKNILTNPVYVKSDKDIYNYYENKGINLYGGSWNGINGLMVYNKTTNLNHKILKRKKTEEWIISVGKHKGIIDGKTFINVANLIEANNNMRYRKTNSLRSPLSGLVKCANCKSNMRPKIRKNKDNEIITDYLCELKEKSKKNLCDAKNINGSIIEDTIISNIMNFEINMTILFNKLKKTLKTDKNSEIKEISYRIKKNNETIKNLIDKIKYIDISIIDDINKEIKELKEENAMLNSRLNKLNANSIDLKDLANKTIKNYKNINNLDNKTKKKYLHLLIKEIIASNNKLIINYK
ncbi:MAG: recombinase family protein [Bacilli bacterium]|nr:recombinase family protein [Bacilli bacterium]